ncbi:hypothetical protein [Polaribacter sp.]|uniref:hypothetical protein n=1 Tax=Polaribacter sp. TaxID=1920175 RepID=UPI003F6C6C12
MKPYIYSILFFLATSISFAQTKKVLINKSYTVDENTVLNLDLDNADVHIITSKDDKIHFNYQMTFYNYSKRKIDILLDKSIVKTTKKKNQIFLKAKNSAFLGIDIKYHSNFDYKNFDNPINIVYKNYVQNFLKIYKERKHLYKTKDSLIAEINFSIGNDFDNYIKKDIDNYPHKKASKSDRKIEKKFVIEVPKNVSLKIKALESDIKLDYDVETNFKMESFKGFFKFKRLNGKNNQINSSNGILETYGLKNSTLKFRDMSKVNIGVISNSKMKLETSTINVGEIGKNVIVTDFDSKIHLYNFNENFKKFNLKGNYTELNLYKVKETNFSMDVFGLNTTLNMDGIKTSFGTSKEKDMFKILQKKRKENIPFLGSIEAELKNGILNIK